MSFGGVVRLGIGVLRISIGGLAAVVLGYAYGLNIAAGDSNPFDYFGCFTNQTTLLMSVLMITAGVFTLTRRVAPRSLSAVRGAGTAYLIVVAVIYNTLVPGTGSAPPWVSAILHVVVPAIVVIDWLMVDDRHRLPWRQLWIVLPYPLIWLLIVLARGATDGWVPYGFLLRENGAVSLILHIGGLLCAVTAAGAIVWAMSRLSICTFHEIPHTQGKDLRTEW